MHSHDKPSAYSLSFLFLICILFASGAHIWGGDWGFGPRLLVFAMGLLALPTAIGLDACLKHQKLRLFALGTFVFSIALNQTVHLFFPEPWAKSGNPIVDIVGPMLDHSLVSPNVMNIHFGVTGLLSLVPAALLTAFIVFRLLWSSFDDRRFKSSIAVLTIATLGFVGTLNLSGTTPSIQKDWVKLVKLWAGKEAQYH